MIINPTILKKVRQIAFTSQEPSNTNVLWAKPTNGLFAFYLFYNNKWELVESSASSDTPVIPLYLSAFINDVGYLTADDIKESENLISSKQIVDGSIEKSDLSPEIENGLHEDVASSEDIKNLFK